MLRHLFWDFDGTLYDSYPHILQSVLYAMEGLGIGGLFSQDEVLRLIKVNVYHAATVCSKESGVDVDAFMQRYYEYHDRETNFAPYKGMKECLQTLHSAGFRHYLYTHRNQSAVEQLRRDGLWPLFSDAVIGTDGFPRKPAPDALQALMARNVLLPAECAMIGDRDIDIQAGHNAGMSGVLFDPDGFYKDFAVEMQAASMAELRVRLMASK